MSQARAASWEADYLQAEFYLARLLQADTLYLQGGDHMRAALAQFDEDWEQIRKGQAWAAQAVNDDDRAAALCLAYPQRGHCLSLRLPPREQLTWVEAGLAAARRLKDRTVEARLLANQGLVLLDLDQPRAALEPLHRAYTLARQIQDPQTEQTIAGNIGVAYWAAGDAQRALTWHARDLNLARQIGNRRGEGTALGNLGAALVALGRPREALGYLEQHLEVAEAVGDRRAAAMALSNLGACQLDLGDPEAEIGNYEQALEIFRELGDQPGEGKILTNLGLAYLHRDRPLARQYLQSAERVFQEAQLPIPLELASALTALAAPGCLLALLSFLRPILAPLTRLGGLHHRTQNTLRANPAVAREYLEKFRRRDGGTGTD